MALHSQNNLPYRHLTNKEIEQLQRQGCTASDWSLIEVHPDILVDFIHHVRFSSWNKIGCFHSDIILSDGLSLHSGIYNATLHQTYIGSNTLIYNNTGYISNYDIEDDCILMDTGIISTEGPTSFGQGTEITVLNETGGREVIIHDKLSSHEAYLQAMYRHDKSLTAHLRTLASTYAESQTSTRGYIGHHATIIRCSKIRNTRIDSYCHLEGCQSLDNGTVCSSKESPSHIGENVICKDFIIQDGCHISDGCQITRCYIGQSSIVGHGFSVSDSYIGCNCQLENGEACAIFAGPYTVSHHKSTLLIGGYFSFMNAGSGTNQSNHMYKLGPSHQGILERGCKTASGSYVLWPLRAGAFSLIMGHFTSHVDTQDFPFSYLIEEQGRHYLVPAIALRNVGTARDIRKWPARDRRNPQYRQLDQLVLEAYSPYTMGKIRRGINNLKALLAQAGPDTDRIEYQSLTIKTDAARKGISLYEAIMDLFLGEQVINKLKELNIRSATEAFIAMNVPQTSHTEWYDAGGLILPRETMTDLISRIKHENIKSLEELTQEWQNIRSSYDQQKWEWTWTILHKQYPVTHSAREEFFTPVLNRYQNAVSLLTQAIIQDAGKEFDAQTRIGFGIDSTSHTADKDFLHVRGDLENNTFVRDLQNECSRKTEESAYWLHIITE